MPCSNPGKVKCCCAFINDYCSPAQVSAAACYTVLFAAALNLQDMIMTDKSAAAVKMWNVWQGRSQKFVLGGIKVFGGG